LVELEYDGIFLTDFYAGQSSMHQRALGAYHMASVLRSRGLRILVIDFIYSMNPENIQTLVDRSVSTNTKFVGLSTTFMYAKISSLDFDKSFLEDDAITAFIKKAKLKNPRIEVFQGGGFHFKSHPMADHWIPGQYVENKLIALLNGRFSLNLQEDYDFVHHDFAFSETDFIVKGEPLPVEVSRGCIFSCKFCSFSGRGKKVNTNIKNYSLIQNYLEDSHLRFQTKSFYLADDTFNESTSKLLDFQKMVKSLSFSPQFCSYIRLDLLMKFPIMLEILQEIGVRGIAFGIETFHAKAGQVIGKGIAPEKVKDFLGEIKVKFPEFYLSSGFIAGLPFEPIESCQESNEWLLKNKVLDSWHFAPLVIDNKLINPNPSEFSQNIEKYDYTRKGLLGWERKDLDFESAGLACREMNLINDSLIGPSPWILFSLLRERHFEDVRHLKNVDLPRFLDASKFAIYREQLLSSFR
jgi:hypothetical protein